MKKIVLMLSIFLLNACDKLTNTETTVADTRTTGATEDGDSDDDDDDGDQAPLHQEFKDLLGKIKKDLNGSLKFSNSRCDSQAMVLFENALASIVNKTSFTPEAIGHGLGNLDDSEIPKDPRDFIKRFIKDGTRCGMPDLIQRMKTGAKIVYEGENIPYDKQITDLMDAMLAKLRAKFNK